MIIYRSADLRPGQSDLNHFAMEVAGHLVPQAKILSSSNDPDSSHLLLRSASTLFAFEFYLPELGEEAFETVLRTAAELESKRKVANDPLLREIGIYLLARGFSKDFLMRVPFGLVEIRLFRWCLIRSETDEAILIHEFGKKAGQERTQIEAPSVERTACPPQHQGRQKELSTPELIAFARLGMELRTRRSQEARTD